MKTKAVIYDDSISNIRHGINLIGSIKYSVKVAVHTSIPSINNMRQINAALALYISAINLLTVKGNGIITFLTCLVVTERLHSAGSMIPRQRRFQIVQFL